MLRKPPSRSGYDPCSAKTMASLYLGLSAVLDRTDLTMGRLDGVHIDKFMARSVAGRAQRIRL